MKIEAEKSAVYGTVPCRVGDFSNGGTTIQVRLDGQRVYLCVHDQAKRQTIHATAGWDVFKAGMEEFISTLESKEQIMGKLKTCPACGHEKEGDA